ncbi:MAG TPA: F0F1 ATP synthase subunit B [Ktedonobacteraceae bacterium]|nr:F0F1 ATP synthase subunit B [Ktedonobacteraceae bacterium]
MVFSFVLAAGSSSGLLDGLGINWPGFISQVVSFGIVLLILAKFGFPIIQRTLEKRTAIIQEGVENAERAKRELAEATANAERIIREARQQQQEIIASAQQLAEKETARIIEEANVRASQLEQQQVARIQQEATRARAELSRMVVNLSINAAGKVISRSVDTKDNRRMVEEFVSASGTKEQ